MWLLSCTSHQADSLIWKLRRSAPEVKQKSTGLNVFGELLVPLCEFIAAERVVHVNMQGD